MKTPPNMKIGILREIGLTETEIRVYETLLRLGAAPAGKISSETGIYRKNTYDALNRLVDKGLATHAIENRKKHFQAKDPRNILRYVDEEKARLDKKRKLLEKVIPSLIAQAGTYAKDIEAEIYRGNEGIKTILTDCLNCSEVLLIGASGVVEDRLPYFWPKYNKARIKRKVRWRLLLQHAAKGKHITKSKFYEFRTLPKTLSSPNVIYIYRDTVANILWLEKPIAFVVRQKDLAKNYRDYFNLLWKASAR